MKTLRYTVVALLFALLLTAAAAQAQTLKNPVRARDLQIKALEGGSAKSWADGHSGLILVYGDSKDKNTQQAVDLLSGYAAKLKQAGANVAVNMVDIQPNDPSMLALAKGKGWGALDIGCGGEAGLAANLAAAGLSQASARKPVVFTIDDAGMIKSVSWGALTGSAKDDLINAALKVAKGAEIRLSDTRKTLNKGKTFSLKPTLQPKVSAKYVRYESSDTSVVRVSQAGKVKGVNYGTATVRAIFGEDVASCEVTVTAPLKSFKLNASAKTAQAGEVFMLDIASMVPFNAPVNTQNATWSSSNPKVAAVSGGSVTALSPGKAKITAKLSGKSAGCTVTVNAAPVDASEVPEETSEGLLGVYEGGSAASGNASANVTPSDNTFEAQILALVNQERKSRGLTQLTRYAPLEASARIRAEEITRSFSHTRPGGKSCFTAISYKVSWGGENIASGYSSAESVMNAWMNSPGHRKNILNANFRELGVGVCEKGGKLYWVQMFTKKK